MLEKVYLIAYESIGYVTDQTLPLLRVFSDRLTAFDAIKQHAEELGIKELFELSDQVPCDEWKGYPRGKSFPCSWRLVEVDVEYRSMKSTAKRFVKLATDIDFQEFLQLMQEEMNERGLMQP